LVKTAVLVSGGGTNLQALIDANIFGELKNCELAAVISSNPDAYALTRAERAGIPSYVVDISIFPNRASFCDALLKKLQDLDIELVVLAGFLYVLTPAFVKEFPNRMINIHPALIPSFCGDGYYGIHVHEKALEYGVKISGATAHFVTTATDSGPIILQKAVEVEENDTPKTLQQRIMEKAEWIILPKAVSLFCEGRLEVNGRVVHIKEAENEN
jgi:phosphoribosylglycinamide formyltransferase-1